jgi:hypothetical protein
MRSPQKPLSSHDRDALISQASPYFFYKASPLAIRLDDIKAVAKVIEKHDTPPPLGLVNQHSLQWVEERAARAGRESLGRLTAAFQVLPDWEIAEFSIISCEWVPPHSDDIAPTDVFASLVLATGGTPYVMSMLKTQRATQGATAVIAEGREIGAGDFFIFAPNRAHMAVPMHSCTGARLTLLQAWVRTGEKRWQESVLRHWPRHTQDEILYAETA